MSEPAAILATFSDLKLIRGRKVAQLIFEIPIENAQTATNALGFPDPAGEQWYGIARVQKSSAGGKDLTHSGSGQPERRLTEAPPAEPNSTRAVMMAKDEGVRRYLVANGWTADDEFSAIVAIKSICGVNSKSDLNGGPGAEAFENLRQDFYAWRRAA